MKQPNVHSASPRRELKYGYTVSRFVITVFTGAAGVEAAVNVLALFVKENVCVDTQRVIRETEAFEVHQLRIGLEGSTKQTVPGVW